MDKPTLEYQEDTVRYTLGEMTPAEEEAFEARMFAEPELAEDIQSLELFRSALREAELTQPATAPAQERSAEPAGWVKWLQGLFRPEVLIPSAAALSLGIVVLTQNIGPAGAPIGAEAQPMALPAFALPSVTLSGAVRGAGDTAEMATLPADARGYHLSMYLDAPDAYEAYDAEIRTASGEFRYRSQLTLGATGAISLFIPGEGMQPGEYDLIVQGRAASAAPHTGETAATARFRVE